MEPQWAPAHSLAACSTSPDNQTLACCLLQSSDKTKKAHPAVVTSSAEASYATLGETPGCWLGGGKSAVRLLIALTGSGRPHTCYLLLDTSVSEIVENHLPGAVLLAIKDGVVPGWQHSMVTGPMAWLPGTNTTIAAAACVFTHFEADCVHFPCLSSNQHGISHTNQIVIVSHTTSPVHMDLHPLTPPRLTPAHSGTPPTTSPPSLMFLAHAPRTIFHPSSWPPPPPPGTPDVLPLPQGPPRRLHRVQHHLHGADFIVLAATACRQ